MDNKIEELERRIEKLEKDKAFLYKTIYVMLKEMDAQTYGRHSSDFTYSFASDARDKLCREIKII